MASHRAEVRQTRHRSREQIVAAATKLVRGTPYGQLTVDEVMREAGLGRTIFYRHFDDLADLLLRVAREAIDELYQAQLTFTGSRVDDGRDVVRDALAPAVAVYERHGPLLRAIADAATGDEQIAADREAMRRRFDALVEDALRAMPRLVRASPELLAETARALGLMNEGYLLDAFGREPRVSAETALQTLTEIWFAATHRSVDPGQSAPDTRGDTWRP